MLFTEHNQNYSLAVSLLASPIELNSGLWLCLIGTHEIPPHIAIINKGKYYSITTNSVKLGEPVEKILKAISRKTIPTVFVSIAASKGGMSEAIRESFASYPVLGNGEHSCLSPISAFLAKAFLRELNSCRLVFDLLSIAQKNEMLFEAKTLFVDNCNNGLLYLPKYTHVQIREKINSILKINE